MMPGGKTVKPAHKNVKRLYDLTVPNLCKKPEKVPTSDKKTKARKSFLAAHKKCRSTFMKVHNGIWRKLSSSKQRNKDYKAVSAGVIEMLQLKCSSYSTKKEGEHIKKKTYRYDSKHKALNVCYHKTLSNDKTWLKGEYKRVTGKSFAIGLAAGGRVVKRYSTVPALIKELLKRTKRARP